jgi:hypothetical protein
VVAKKEAKLEYAAGLEGVNEDLSVFSEKETDFLPITTKAYLYLSGIPFKALATGEFIEEQIFNWTYTDEQRAKAEFTRKHPAKRNPYGALPQMRLLTYQMPEELLAIASGFDSKTITLSCGKLTTGVTVPRWSSILMLRNLSSPETYFQAAFRVQSPWSIKNPNGDNPNEEEILKPVCFVFDFAPTRALRQLSEYGIGLSPNESNPENAVRNLVSFLPVIAYDGANMTQIDAGGILDIAMAGTSATLLARKWESALLVNVDNDTLRRVLDNPEAMAAVGRIEGWRALGDHIIETIINKSDRIKDLKKKAKEKELSKKEKKELSDEEREADSKC